MFSLLQKNQEPCASYLAHTECIPTSYVQHDNIIQLLLILSRIREIIVHNTQIETVTTHLHMYEKLHKKSTVLILFL